MVDAESVPTAISIGLDISKTDTPRGSDGAKAAHRQHMLILVVYLLILATAAALTYVGFGNADRFVHPGGGLDLFYQKVTGSNDLLESAAHTTDKKKLFDCDSELQRSCVVTSSQQHMLNFLENHCCVLPVKAVDVSILRHPTQFYETLKQLIGEAQNSIVISALYVGDGPLSCAFVACLEAKVRVVVEGRRRLPPADVEPFVMTILLDYNRMHDRRNLLTMKALLTLAHTTALEEERRDPRRPPPLAVRLFLYQSPCRWNRLCAPFGRAKEVLGVQHTKLFCFDGKHTVLTGANLSDDYFSTRMDRYVVFRNNTHVASWYAQLVHTLTAVSHPVVCRQDYLANFDGEDLVVTGRRSLHAILSRFTAVVTGKGPASTNGSGHGRPPTGSPPRGSPTLHSKSDLVLLPNALGIDPSLEVEAFEARAHQLMQEFAQRVASECDGVARQCLLSGTSTAYDTVLFPTVQFGRAGVYHDGLVVRELLASTTAADRVFLASPYMNMYAAFTEQFVYGQCEVDCVTASTTTNGWSGQQGFAGNIPYFYLQLERVFYYLVKAYGALDRVRVHEFSAPGLTYHAKGLWLACRVPKNTTAAATMGSCPRTAEDPQTNGDTAALTPLKGCSATGNGPLLIDTDTVAAPYLVAYGSTNYGYRSVHKDVEAEGFLFTWHAPLRAAMREELVYLLQQSSTVTEERFVGRAMGRFQPVVSLVAQLGQDFL